MKWPDAFTAALKRRFLCACRASTASLPQTSEVACPIAANTKPLHLPAGMPNLEQRALMLHNRSRKGAALYLEKHAILSKGVCSDE